MSPNTENGLHLAIASAVADVARQLSAAGLTLACAESCTGGWIAKCLTDLPGSSAWFSHGLVCYSNAAKQRLLAVDPALIAEHGAVSEAVARAMVEGLLDRDDADFGISVTGIAGPDGGSAEKPLGTVWIAWAAREQASRAHCYQFAGDRNAVRLQAVQAAIEEMAAMLARACPGSVK